jgi:pentatricopeptide repeat protein
VLTASVQSDCSSDDEKLSCASYNERVRKRPNSLTSDSVVQMLRCLRKRPTITFAYFKDTHNIGFHHDVSTYSEIIHILSYSCQGKMLLSLFFEIVSRTGSGGLVMLPLIDHLRKACSASYALSFAVNCLIKAYSTCHDAQETREMFMNLCGHGFIPSVWVCNFLLKFVAHSGEMGMVVATYDQMKIFEFTLDAHSLNVVTRSLFQENKVIEAYRVWLQICEMGVKPDAHGYLSFLTGLCDCGKYNLASVFLEEITKERVPIEAMPYNIIIDRLCKQMKLEEAEKVLANIRKHGSTPDAYAYSCLIHSYCKMGNLRKALDHCEAMEYHGIKINCHIAGYLLQSMRKLGLTSEVTVHFKKFRDSGLHLDGVLYNIAIDAYCKLGNMNEAAELMDEMMAEGLSPDKIHYTCLINGYCLKGEILNALLAFEWMLKEIIKPDTVIYNILASGFCRNGVVSEVFDVLDHIVRILYRKGIGLPPLLGRSPLGFGEAQP